MENFSRKPWRGRYAATLLWVTLSSALAAENRPTLLKPDDFAYGIDIEAPAGGPVFKFDLSEDVYRGVKKADLRDLRVFNSQGEVVPHSLQHQVFEERQSSIRQPVTVFPIEGNPVDTESGNSIEVREDAAGKVVNVRFAGQSSANPERTLAYLLDLRKQEQSLKSLEFEWISADINRVIPVQIEASDDLKYWRPITSGAVLAKLAYQGEKLEQKKIEFPEIKSKFLKVTWEKNVPFKLDSVVGEFVSGQRVESPRVWTKITGDVRPQGKDVASTQQGEEYLFDAQAARPVDSVKVSLPDANTILRIRLASSGVKDGPWFDRYAETIYRVSVDGKELVSKPIQLKSATSDRYWLLRVEGKDSSLGGRPVEIELGWVPHQLSFLARGSGPFRLAYGSAFADRTDFGFSSLMESLKVARGGQPVVPLAAQLVGGQKELGGLKRLTPPPEIKPVPWKQWALWAALALAVILVGSMAWSLYRDLSRKNA